MRCSATMFSAFLTHMHQVLVGAPLLLFVKALCIFFLYASDRKLNGGACPG